MSSSIKASLGDGKLPVFVFPTTLTFYSNDQSSHKQILTLYNPYEGPLKFKVLCTAPRKYSVIDSEGTIKPRCCVDVVIRHMDICINHEGVQDRFRVHMSEVGQKKIIGKKDIISVLLPTKRKESSPFPEDKFHSLPPSHRRVEAAASATNTSAGAATGTHGPGLLVIFTAISCIIALMLPLQGETGSRFPDYLLLTVNQKLIAAYVLGLVTMLILHV
ncbi:hypothetical protein ACJMK2_017861 [Sinanodonta woodiana]|uniref:Motile sperm domain-containing protein 3 n=1 Tax=Sinanodonta woodiana TaxID=1069815 RepID=A0ABD3UEM6_SINWO